MRKTILIILTLALTGGGLLWAKDIWYCPMHPHYTSDKPGKCPICGMDLVKKEGHPSAEHAMQEHLGGVDGHAAVALTGDFVQAMGVKTALIQRQVLRKTVRAAGYISTNHELYELQNQYVDAYIEYVTRFRDYKRFEHARKNWDTHRDLQIKIHETQDNLLRLGLGMDQIGKLQQVSWKTLWDQPELLFFKEDAPYWVVAQIFEADRGFVETGQEVEVEILSYAEKTKGIIRSIGGIFDPQTRTVNALIELTGYRGELEGNMFVNVGIPADLNEFLIVPQTAVMDTGLKKVVYVEEKPGVFTPRIVETGPLGDNGWVVKAGLKEGDKVAVEGNFLLDSESRLQAAIGGQPGEVPNESIGTKTGE